MASTLDGIYYSTQGLPEGGQSATRMPSVGGVGVIRVVATYLREGRLAQDDGQGLPLLCPAKPCPNHARGRAAATLRSSCPPLVGLQHGWNGWNGTIDQRLARCSHLRTDPDSARPPGAPSTHTLIILTKTHYRTPLLSAPMLFVRYLPLALGQGGLQTDRRYTGGRGRGGACRLVMLPRMLMLRRPFLL